MASPSRAETFPQAPTSPSDLKTSPSQTRLTFSLFGISGCFGPCKCITAESICSNDSRRAAVLEAIKGLGNIPYQRFINWPSALVAYYCGPRLQSARHWTIQQSDSPSDAPLSPPPPFPPPRTPRHRTTEPLGEYPRPPNPSPTLSSSSSDCLSGGDLEEFLENAFLEDEEASAFFQDGTNRTSLTDNFGAYSLWEEDTENEEKPLASSGLPMAPQVLSADTVCSKYPTAYPELYLRSSSEQPGSVRSGSPRRRVHGAGRGKGKSRPCRKGFWIVIRGKFPGIYTDRLVPFHCVLE